MAKKTKPKYHYDVGILIANDNTMRTKLETEYSKNRLMTEIGENLMLPWIGLGKLIIRSEEIRAIKLKKIEPKPKKKRSWISLSRLERLYFRK